MIGRYILLRRLITLTLAIIVSLRGGAQRHYSASPRRRNRLLFQRAAHASGAVIQAYEQDGQEEKSQNAVEEQVGGVRD